MSNPYNHNCLLSHGVPHTRKGDLDVNMGKRRFTILVYQSGQSDQTARTMTLQVTQGSVILKDVSSHERLQHLNIKDNKARQKQVISAVSDGA